MKESLPETPTWDDFDSSTPAMQGVVSAARRLAAVDSAVLIRGEVGVGKEWLATAIHRGSPRADGPFVAVNCAAIPAAELDAELFTCAVVRGDDEAPSPVGRFVQAAAGTLFLDEIDALPAAVQAKLLRTIETGVILPPGGRQAVRVDTRVMAATQRDLRVAVESGAFRGDLHYRLSIAELTVPPLRERVPDIPRLIERCVRRCALRLGRAEPRIPPESLELLILHTWPGNLRELASVIERGVLLAADDQIAPDQFFGLLANGGRRPAQPSTGETGLALPDAWFSRTWSELRDDLLRQAERSYIDRLLRETGGRVGLAARKAGLSPRALFEKMRRHGLSKDQYRG